MIKQMLTLSFGQYKALGKLIDANGGISPVQHRFKMRDFQVLRRRGLAIASIHFGRMVFFISPKFGVEALVAYQHIQFETECCGLPGNHELVADGYVTCLDCGDNHAKLKMVKNG